MAAERAVSHMPSHVSKVGNKSSNKSNQHYNSPHKTIFNFLHARDNCMTPVINEVAEICEVIALNHW